MKDLKQFRQIVEEEKTDYSKFDMLVRAGLANKSQLQRIHRVLDKMKEDKPVLTSVDRAIVQELLNKMVSIVTDNKQIFQQTRRVVKEELEEGILDTSDYKIGPSGKKEKAHRIKVGDVAFNKEDFELTEAPLDFDSDPPFVLVLKRRAIRMYPDKTKVALYYSKTLDKYFSVPYGGPMGAVVQAEEIKPKYEQDDGPISEAVMDQLHKIVKEKQAQTVKFGNGQSKKVDHFTASAITQVHNALNDENKKKFADMVHKSPAHLAKASDFAFSRAK